MFFSNQAEHERYHAPENRERRRREAEKQREATVSHALSLFNDGDVDGAKEALATGGISDEGISEYLRIWRS